MSSGTTALRKRPFPELSDAPLVAADIEALAESVDTTPTFTVGALSARPTTGMAAGDMHFVTGDSTASNNGITYQYDGTKWVCPHSMADGRVGEVRDYTGTSDPVDPDGVTRWVIADGRPLNRADYPVAFALWAETFGAGDGTSTFNIPDGRGKAIIGTGQGSGLTNRNLGDHGGEETHLLTGAESGERGHGHGVTDPGHEHSTEVPSNNTETTAYTTGFNNFTETGSITGITGSNTTGLTVNSIGASNASNAHNNMQPFLALPHIVRVQ